MMKRLGTGWIVASFVMLALVASTGVPAADACGTIARLGDQPAGCIAEAGVYIDPRRLVFLSYPSTWAAESHTSSQVSFVTLDSPGGGAFALFVIDPPFGPSVADEVQSIWESGAKTIHPYTHGPASDTRIAGEPAQTFGETAVLSLLKGQPDAPSRMERVWVVFHNGTELRIIADAVPADTAVIEAIIASITFLR